MFLISFLIAVVLATVFVLPNMYYAQDVVNMGATDYLIISMPAVFSKTVTVYFGFSIFIAYEVFYRSKMINAAESIHTIAGLKKKIFFGQLSNLIIFAFICFLINSAFSFTYYFLGDGKFDILFIQVLKINILNILLPCIVGILIGANIAKFASRITAYLIMIFWFSYPLHLVMSGF